MDGQNEIGSEDEHVLEDLENAEQQFLGEDQRQGSASSSSWCGLSGAGIERFGPFVLRRLAPIRTSYSHLEEQFIMICPFHKDAGSNVPCTKSLVFKGNDDMMLRRLQLREWALLGRQRLRRANISIQRQSHIFFFYLANSIVAVCGKRQCFRRGIVIR